MRDSDEGFMDGLGDASLAAKLIVEEDERFEREGEAFLARVRSFRAPPDSDLERDALHDSGEDEWRDE